MAEVEDVAGAAARAREHVARRRRRRAPTAPSSTAGSRLPCTPRRRPTCVPAAVERDPPVEADHVAARGCERPAAVAVRPCRSGSSARRRRRGCARCTARRTRVVGGRERADPRVEELHHVGAGRDLLAHVARRSTSASFVHQRVPRVRLAVHQRLHLREVARRLALDEVARDGERRRRRSRPRPARSSSSPRTIRDRLESSGATVAPGSREPRRVRAPAGRRPGRRPRRARRRRPSRGPGS